MRKNNKLLATSLVAAMAVSAFAGCSKSGDTATTTAAGGSSSNTTTTAAVETTEAPASYGQGTITIWVAENVVDFTKEYAQKFIDSNEAYKGYTVDVQPVGEGEAASNMITDVQSGADIYGFAQDQIGRAHV